MIRKHKAIRRVEDCGATNGNDRKYASDVKFKRIADAQTADSKKTIGRVEDYGATNGND